MLLIIFWLLTTGSRLLFRSLFICSQGCVNPCVLSSMLLKTLGLPPAASVHTTHSICPPAHATSETILLTLEQGIGFANIYNDPLKSYPKTLRSMIRSGICWRGHNASDSAAHGVIADRARRKRSQRARLIDAETIFRNCEIFFPARCAFVMTNAQRAGSIWRVRARLACADAFIGK